MSISASAAYNAARNLQQQQQLLQQQQAIVLNNATNAFPTPAEAAVVSTSASVAGMGSSSSRDSGLISPESCTPTALGRWSLLNHKLPEANAVRSIHIYDFDNTLFKTPLPNPKLWAAATIGSLSSNTVFNTGGWWHDVRILAATGSGQAIEEPQAWEGWWNEKIVELVRLSMKEPGALCVLLTGRSDRGFGDLIQRMVNSKKLVFDMIVLKPASGPNNEKFSSTMNFKQAYLETLMETYSSATEIRIYEDRPRHVDGFREFLSQYNERREKRAVAPLPPIDGEVVFVTDTSTTLDPVVEVAEVQHMINCHNAAGGGKNGQLALNKTVFFTGYLIKDADTERLLELLHLPAQINRRDIKFHANSIMIGPRVCPPHLLAKAGGMGSKMTWRVEAIGNMNNSVWAVKVRPAVPGTTYHTAEATPLAVLAVYRSARPYEASQIRRWVPLPADKVFDIETTVGEKAILRVESEHAGDQSESSNGPPFKRHRGASTRPYGGIGASNRPRPNPAGTVPTQPAAMAVPRGPSGQFGPQGGGGRGYHFQAAGRGGFRGGFNGGRGNFRGGGGGGGGGGQTPRVGPRNAGAQGHAGPGVAASKATGRSTGHFNYQSLDDAGPASTPAAASQGLQRQKIVYDD